MAYTDKIAVVRGHLESIQEALEAGVAYHAAEDLRDNARTVGAHQRQSRITALLENNLAHVNGYLVVDDELPG